MKVFDDDMYLLWLLFSERTEKKQRGGEGEAVSVFVLLLILGIVGGGLVWHFTRDDSSPTPTPTPTPDNQNNGNENGNGNGNDNSHGNALMVTILQIMMTLQ